MNTSKDNSIMIDEFSNGISGFVGPVSSVQIGNIDSKPGSAIFITNTGITSLKFNLPGIKTATKDFDTILLNPGNIFHIKVTTTSSESKNTFTVMNPDNVNYGSFIIFVKENATNKPELREKLFL
jgi:hypothetical protein